MNKQEILQVMQKAFDKANKDLCLQNGMSEADADDSIAKSNVTIAVLLTEVLNELEQKNIVQAH